MVVQADIYNQRLRHAVVAQVTVRLCMEYLSLHVIGQLKIFFTVIRIWGGSWVE